MKGKRFTEEEIIGVLKEVDGGSKVIDVCRKYGISDNDFRRINAESEFSARREEGTRSGHLFGRKIPFRRLFSSNPPVEPRVPPVLRLDSAQSMGSQLRPSKDDLDRLFITTARYWRERVSDVKDLYYSVLSQDAWRGVLTWEDKLNFLATGKFYVARVHNIYERFAGKRAKDASCIDFGCGVGRLSVWAVSEFRQVFGVDFSSKHLDEASANVAQAGSANSFSGILLNNLSDLSLLPNVDLCYSFITLQHNTPPVMATILNSLLSALNPGGIAVLHIPLAIPNYHFDTEEYLGSAQSGMNMEMHVLPKRDIYDIAEGSDCEIAYSECIGGADIAYSEDIVFRKRGA